MQPRQRIVLDPAAATGARFGRGAAVAVVAVFVALLLVPAALALRGHAGPDTEFIGGTELRAPFEAPPVTSGALATGGWERDVERELGDGFPLRTQLILGYDYVKYLWLGDVASALVMRGRDGWLFLGNDEERTSLRGGPPDDVLRHVADVYAARSAWCARHGMRYAFVLAPNKSTIYAGELPDGIAPVTPSAADRLMTMLRARGVAAVDPRAALVAAARDGEVYSKGDTHWNGAGAYVAYRATMAELRLPDPFADRALRRRITHGGGDLLRMAGVAGVIPNAMVYYRWRPRWRDVPLTPAAQALAFANADVSAHAFDDPALPALVAFGDSFIIPIAPYFEQTFRRTVIVHHRTIVDAQFDEPLLLAEHPAVVLQVLAERNLTQGDKLVAP